MIKNAKRLSAWRLKILGVSYSGYKARKDREPSETKLRGNRVKEKIIDIYDHFHQNYGAPKITAELRKNGEVISERKVGKYMREIGIKAQWIRTYTHTTVNSDFSSTLKNILNEQFNPESPNSRKIIAWTLSETLEAEHVAETVHKAIQKMVSVRQRVY